MNGAVQVWGDSSKYACKCPPSSPVAYNLSCCTTYTSANQSPEPCTCLDGETASNACCENGNNFLPDSLTVLFDEIKADDVVRSIIQVQPVLPCIQLIFLEAGSDYSCQAHRRLTRT